MRGSLCNFTLNFLDLKKRYPLFPYFPQPHGSNCKMWKHTGPLQQNCGVTPKRRRERKPKKKNQKEGEERWPFFTLSATQNPPEEREREASLALSDPMATDLVEAPSPTSQSPSHYRFFYNCFNFWLVFSPFFITQASKPAFAQLN